MKAVIVAAGKSSRLRACTNGSPKCLLPVGGAPIIRRSLGALAANGVGKVIVVTGHQREKLREALAGEVQFVLNPFYEQTNNMASLWLAMPHVNGDDFVYMHGDVVFHDDLLGRLVRNRGGCDIDLLVDFDSVDEEAMKVRAVGGRFVESSKTIPLSEAAGEWTGLAIIGSGVSQALHSTIGEILAEGRLRDYDTSALNRLAKSGVSIGMVPTDGLPWCELDTPEDLARARALFEPGDAA